MPEELGGDKSVTFNIELSQIIKGRKYTIDSEEGWTELTYTAKGLQGGRLYSIQIQTVNAYTQSDKVEIDFIFLQKPDPPTNFFEDYRERTDSSLLLKWSAPEDKGGQFDITYVLEQQTNSKEWQTIEADLTVLQSLVQGLETGESYSFRVRAQNNYTKSEPSNELVYNPWVLRKKALFNLKEVSRTDNSIDLQWVAPKIVAGSIIQTYNIELAKYEVLNKPESLVYKTVVYDWKTLKITMKDVKVGWVYSYKVLAIDQNKNKIYSDPLEVRFLSKPSPPTRIWEAIEQRTEFSLVLTWEQPADMGGAASVTYAIKVIDSFGSDRFYESETNSLKVPDLYISEEYQFYVATLNDFAKSEWSQPFDVLMLSKPSEPRNIREEFRLRREDTTVIRWDPPRDSGGAIAVHYGISLAVEGEEPVLIEDHNLFLQIQLSGLKVGETYNVTVYSINNFGRSDKSISTTFFFTTRPSEPLNLEEDKTQRTNSSIVLNWQQPKETGGNPTFTYTLVIYDSAFERVTILQENLENSFTTVDNLAIGDEYEFRVRAVYKEFESALSAGYILNMVGKPNPPVEVHEAILEREDNSALIHWTEPEWTGLTYGGEISYVFQLYSQQDELLQTVETSELEYRVDQLINDRTYRIRLQTFNGDVYSEQSEALEFHFVSNPWSPSSLSEVLEERTDSTLKLVWVAPQSMENHLSYSVYNADTKEVIGADIQETSFMVEQLEAGVTYTFYVLNVVDQEDEIHLDQQHTSSEPLSILFLIAPSEPLNIEEVSRTDSSITLSWTEPKSLGGDTSVSYAGQIQTTDVDPVSFESASPSYTFDAVEAGLTYTVTIWSINTNYRSVDETRYEFTFMKKPSQPLDLVEVVDKRTLTTMDLAWTAPLDNGGSEISYTVYRLECGAEDKAVRISDTTETTFTVDDLEVGIVYCFEVTSNNKYTESNPSNQLSVRMMSKPSAPTDLVELLDKRTATSFTIAWTAPVDLGGAESELYNAYLYLGEELLETVTVSVTEASFSGLAASQTYTVVVDCDNGYMKSDQSEPVSLLLQGEPSIPAALDVQLNFETGNLDFTWLQESDGGFPITNFDLLGLTSRGQWISLNNMCDQETMIQNSTCAFDLETLKSAPLSLTFRDTLCLRLEAANEWGKSGMTDPWCFEKIIYTQPGSAQNLTEDRSGRSGTSLGLKWEPPIWRGGRADMPLEYIIVMKNEKGKFEKNGVTTENSFVVQNLTAGESYTLAVVVRNPIGLSVFSDIVELWVSWVPSEPQNVVVERAKIDSRVNISWSEPLTDNASPIRAYRVLLLNNVWNDTIDITERCLIDDLLTRQVCLVEMGFLTKSIAPDLQKGFNLTDKDEVCVQIQAINGWGGSKPSPVQCFANIVIVPPQPPLELKEDLSARDYDSLGLTWTRPPTGGTDDIHYSLFVKKEKGLILVAKNIRKENAQVHGLTLWKEYTFVLKTHNIMGVSEESEPLTLTCAWKPIRPEQVKVVNFGEFEVNVEWAKAMPKGSPITSAKVFINSTESGLVEVTDSCEWSEDVKTCTLSQRVLYYEPFFKTQPKEEVCVRVSVENMYGESELSELFCAIIEMQQTPSAPDGLENRDKITDQTQIGVTWQDAYSVTHIEEYLMYSDLGKGDDSWNLVEKQIEGDKYKSHSCSGLQMNTDALFGFRVSAMNFIGEGPMSEPIYLRMNQEQKQQLANVTQIEKRFINVDWSETVTNQAVHYSLMVANTETGEYKAAALEITETQIDIEVPYGRNFYQVYGFYPASQKCACEEPSFELEKYAVTLPIEFGHYGPPETPTNLQTQFYGNDSIKVTWDPANDGGLTQTFEVQLLTSFINENQTVEEAYVTIGQTVISDFYFEIETSQETYEFRVRASNEKGVSEFTQPVTKEQVNEVKFTSVEDIVGKADSQEENEKAPLLLIVSIVLGVIALIAVGLLSRKAVKRDKVSPSDDEKQATQNNTSCRQLKNNVDTSVSRIEDQLSKPALVIEEQV